MTESEKFIILVDNDILEKSDAIVLLEGDGFNRYQKAVSLYKKGMANKIIFSGGITNYEYGSYPFSDILPKILETGVPEEAIIHEDKSINTREQAVEVVKICLAKNWKKLILVATHEHQYRAYLTFLREVLDSKSGIFIYNAPARNLGWFTETGWGLRIDRLDIEFERISRYSSMGHLATYLEAIEYQKWKELQK